jgi:energy-coupling factor transport system permease protein
VYVFVSVLSGSATTFFVVWLVNLFIIMLGGFLRKTTSVTERIVALETMRVPQLVIIPVAVSARYIPSIQEDFKCLKDSLRVRNIPVTLGSFIRHPVRTIEYLLVPILMRSLKVSDELAASAMLRGLDNGKRKTQLRVLRIRCVDIAALSMTAVVVALTVYLQYGEI